MRMGMEPVSQVIRAMMFMAVTFKMMMMMIRTFKMTLNKMMRMERLSQVIMAVSSLSYQQR